MVNVGKASDGMLDALLAYQERTADTLRQMDLLQIIDPTLHVVFDDLRERLKRP